MNQNGGIHKGGFAVLCHRNGGSESPGILSFTFEQFIRKSEVSHIWSAGWSVYSEETKSS